MPELCTCTSHGKILLIIYKDFGNNVWHLRRIFEQGESLGDAQATLSSRTDAQEIYCSDTLCLAHALLGIVGEGKQPFFGCNKGFVLVCNGEIYNYEELRKKLANHVFSTTSDNEVIIHLVEENFNRDLIKAIENTLKQLDGDFAFAIAYKGKVAIARDFVGVKPLYFGNNAFASERKALWKINEKAEALLPEPIGKNTAPAIALASLYLGDEKFLVMPSDHVMSKEFLETAEKAEELANNYLVTLWNKARVSSHWLWLYKSQIFRKIGK